MSVKAAAKPDSTRRGADSTRVKGALPGKGAIRGADSLKRRPPKQKS
jgi:hypothetical protein